jgi:hypothetical protein
MTEYRREREVEIERYQILEREVTDPLAAGLLRCIIEQLEAALCGSACETELPFPRPNGAPERRGTTGATDGPESLPASTSHQFAS